MKKHVAAVVAILSAVTLASADTGARTALAARSYDVVSMLTWALQDERLAFAGYKAAIDALGPARPFRTITRAEETHIARLLEVFAAHGVAVPPDMTAAPAAPRDLAAALENGRQSEIDTIAMYDRFLAQSLPDDVREVFVQLEAASQNHLRAFVTGAGART